MTDPIPPAAANHANHADAADSADTAHIADALKRLAAGRSLADSVVARLPIVERRRRAAGLSPSATARDWAAGQVLADIVRTRLAEARGDFGTARRLAEERPWTDACLRDPEPASRTMGEALYGGDAATRARALDLIDECLSTRPEPIPSWAATWRMRLGEPALALAAIEAGLSGSEITVLNMLWGPRGRDVRRLPQFPEFARRVGFAALWDQHGPPDRCQRRGPGDYVCN